MKFRCAARSLEALHTVQRGYRRAPDPRLNGAARAAEAARYPPTTDMRFRQARDQLQGRSRHRAGPAGARRHRKSRSEVRGTFETDKSRSIRCAAYEGALRLPDDDSGSAGPVGDGIRRSRGFAEAVQGGEAASRTKPARGSGVLLEISREGVVCRHRLDRRRCGISSHGRGRGEGDRAGACAHRGRTRRVDQKAESGVTTVQIAFRIGS